MNTTNEIVLYQPDNSVELEVRLENETVWLNRQQMSVLFDRDIKTIGKHINNALREELAPDAIVAKFATTEQFPSVAKNATVHQIPSVANFATLQIEGNREVLRNIEYYNLDMILSVGYRVKSNQGIKFRAWANSILKDYLLRGYAINQRVMQLEHRVTENEKQIAFFVRTAIPPKEGVFFDGQIFDAYVFVSDLIKTAKKYITLLDNYIDENVLLLLSKRQEKVKAEIFTKQISEQLQLDLTKHNAQYTPINISELTTFHDRFLVIDDVVYHIGASLKDLGKKLFAFSKMEIKPKEILNKI